MESVDRQHTKPDYKPSYNTHFVSQYEALLLVANDKLIKDAETEVRAAVNLGTAKFTLGDPAAALALYLRALKIEPDNAVIHCNISVAYGEMTRFDLALQHAQIANGLDPTDRYAASVYAENLLRAGQWKMGWELYERCRFGKTPCPILWKGEDLEGKRLLVYHEGGHGDAFMNFRFFRELKGLGAEVTFAVEEPLHCIFKDHPWVDKLLRADKYGPELRIKVTDYDYAVSSYILPALFVDDIEHFPSHGPYLATDHAVHHLREKPRVGLCWSAGEGTDTKRHRRLTKENVKQLTSIQKVEWVGLQYERDADSAQLGIDIPQLKTWEDTAEIIDGLDLVISVDTGVMHLAGAIGKPVWTLLSNSCWRFFTGRDDCVWYPQMWLFRNRGVGFDSAVADVCTVLNNR